MEKYFHILLALLINFVFASCSHLDNEGGVLEERANYDGQINQSIPKPVSRTRGKVKKAWLHPHEMPTGDYFGGAWVYLLVEETKWTFPESTGGKFDIRK